MVDAFASGESKSKLAPPEGVLDPVIVEGDCKGDSFVMDGYRSVGDATLAFSWPVTASDMVLRPKVREDFSVGFPRDNQLDPFDV